MTDNDNDQRAEDVTGGEPSRFVPTSPTSKTRRPPPAPGAGGAAARLAVAGVQSRPDAGARFLLDRATTTAGRQPNSDIVLDDVTVSRRHAEFQGMEDHDVQVVDVGSLNGIYVNRQPVDSATMTDGDEVQLGKFRLVFLTRGPAR